MRRFLFTTILVVLAFVVSTVFANGVQEVGEKTLTVLGIKAEYKAGMFDKYEAEHPNVKLELLSVDRTDGTAVTIDSLLAAGTPPDVYSGFIGRIAKLLTPEYAIPLDGHIDRSKYFEFLLDACNINGQQLGMPHQFYSSGMNLNLDILDDAGYVVPDGWDMQDWFRMAEKVKAGTDKNPSGLFAVNSSGSYCIMAWFPVFGAELFKNGDYSKTTIDSPEGVAVFDFFKVMQDAGYFQSDVATIRDLDFRSQWATGQIAAASMPPGWHGAMYDAVKKGELEKPFRNKFVWMPNKRAAGSPGMRGIVGHDTGDEARNARIIEFIKYMGGAHFQLAKITAMPTVMPVRKDVPMDVLNEDTRRVLDYVAKVGLYDVGYKLESYGQLRVALPQTLQGLFGGKLTPAEAAADYAKRIREAIE